MKRIVFLVALLSLALPFAANAAGPQAVGLWRFNEGSGTTASDSSGNGNTGTLTGTNGYPQWAPSMAGFGTALRFTNDDIGYSYVSVPGSASLRIGQTPTNAWSITFWAYEDSEETGDFISDYGRFLAIDDGQAFGFQSGSAYDGETYTFSGVTNAWDIAWSDPSVTPQLDTWEHWALVYDGTNLTLYLDGDETGGGISSTPVTAALSYAGYQGAMIFGSQTNQPPDVNFNGLLDDIAVFNGALSQSQINTIMTGDFSQFTGGPAVITTPPTSIVAPQGASVTFSVGASGEAPFSYQWYEGATPLAGANNATLVLTDVQTAQDGSYSVAVSNSLGGQSSAAATLSVIDTPLVALWRFNETSGTNALDSSGLGNNGVFKGESTNFPGRLPGMPGFGNALSVTNDGVNHSYVAVPASPFLQIGQAATNPWSITAWAYEKSDTNGDFVAHYGRIMVIDDDTALRLESGDSDDDEFYTWSISNPELQIGWGIGNSVSPLLNQWEHWALVYNGTTLTLYRNGNQGTNGGVETQAVSAALGYAGYAGSVNIGSEVGYGADANWNGLLDDIAVFDVALTQAQIQQIMTGNFSAFLTLSQPTLTITGSGTSVIISWPAADSSYQLESTSALAHATWFAVTTAPVQNGNSLTVTLPVASHPQFFRLIGP